MRGGDEREQKERVTESKTFAETEKDETLRLVSTARFSAGIFLDKFIMMHAYMH